MDIRPQFQIVNNLIRHSDLDYDTERAAASFQWMWGNSLFLLRTNEAEEHQILFTIYGYWVKHKNLPSRNILCELLWERSKNKPLLHMMAHYDKYEPDLEDVSHLD